MTIKWGKGSLISMTLVLILAATGCSNGQPKNSPTNGSASDKNSPAVSPSGQPSPGPSARAVKPAAGVLDTIMLNGEALNANRLSLKSGQSEQGKAALNKLKEDADQALKAGPFSVVNKTSTPPSGDKHDYTSMAPYWWPDPKKPDGKPYIKKDGQTNPERDTNKYDAGNFGRMANNVNTLSLAYYFTENEAYAERAALLLRTWFLNAETKMNPNMNFGQSVPGVADGRSEGVLDALKLIELSDSVQLLQGSKSWTANDYEGYKKWLTDFVKWLKENKLAIAEKNTKNNHSTWYDAQLVSYSLFLGDKAFAEDYLKKQVPARIRDQIKADGTMPLEMSRTRSLHYPIYNLHAFSILAICGSKVGYDLWNYKTDDGKSIRGAYDFLVPYLNGKPWEQEQIKVENEMDFAKFLRSAAGVYKDKTYLEAADKLLGSQKTTSRINLTAPLPKL